MSDKESMTKLILQNLVKVYQKKRVVNSVSLEIESGGVVGLLGPNGAGKTTTFYMTIGMINPDDGQVFLDEENITDYPMHLRARRGIGYLPQEPSIFRKLTVEQNVLAILETFDLSRTEMAAKTDLLLNELGIRDLANKKANVLSGGQRRRLEITRALATSPSFILLDEPFAGIDPLAVADIKSIIDHLKTSGIGIMISDHNVRETLSACDEAYILYGGEIIESGSPEKIASSETAARAYLGDDFRL